jgi:hypothetical protein
MHSTPAVDVVREPLGATRLVEHGLGALLVLLQGLLGHCGLLVLMVLVMSVVVVVAAWRARMDSQASWRS